MRSIWESQREVQVLFLKKLATREEIASVYEQITK